MRRPCGRRTRSWTWAPGPAGTAALGAGQSGSIANAGSLRAAVPAARLPAGTGAVEALDDQRSAFQAGAETAEVLAGYLALLGADFELDVFEHRAFYNGELGRVEMHLTAASPQRVHVNGHRFDFQSGESLHTEDSYKYSVAEFRVLAEQAGLIGEQVWQDDENLFSVHCLRAS